MGDPQQHTRHRQSGGHTNRHRWSPRASHQGQDQAKRTWDEVTRQEGMALGFWGPEAISPGAKEPDAGALCHPQHQSPESTKTGRQEGDPGRQGSLRRTSSSSGQLRASPQIWDHGQVLAEAPPLPMEPGITFSPRTRFAGLLPLPPPS